MEIKKINKALYGNKKLKTIISYFDYYWLTNKWINAKLSVESELNLYVNWSFAIHFCLRPCWGSWSV
jgi:hypothetical protein